MFLEVIEKERGKVEGRKEMMRIEKENGVIEIGRIYWGKIIQRRNEEKEEKLMLMKYVLDVIGYSRYEWE